MTKEEYGDYYENHLMDEYKLFVEMADRIRTSRIQTSKYYLSLLTGLTTIYSIFFKDKLLSMNALSGIVIAVMALGLTILWFAHLMSYKQLSIGKFTILREMEKSIPFPYYTEEFKVLQKEREKDKFATYLTSIEIVIPFIFAIPYALLLIYFLVLLF